MFALFPKEGRGDSPSGVFLFCGYARVSFVKRDRGILPPGVLCFLTYAMVAFQRGDYLTYFIFPGEETNMQRTLSFIIGLILLLTAIPAFAVTSQFIAVDDSYISETSPNSNFGSKSELLADGDDGAGKEMASLIKWDVSSIPAGSTVISASIVLNIFDDSSGAYNIFRQTKPWSEDSVTWSDLSDSTTVLGVIPQRAYRRITVNLNSAGINLIQDWIDGALSNDGITIRNSGTHDGIDMSSKESGGFPPTLEITYTFGPQTLEERVAYLESLLANVNLVGNTLRFEGINVQVVNGLGVTDGDPNRSSNVIVNGLGNLIVGYDEPFHCRFEDQSNCFSQTKSGSHNLIVGQGNSYSSAGGFVAGVNNTISGRFSSVSGGASNKATGGLSSISGGRNSTASGTLSSISGGSINTASGTESSVSGGSFNIAQGSRSSVTGGSHNTASGGTSSISGGSRNTASGGVSSISGGENNIASGAASSISGGSTNTASGRISTVSGGRSRTAAGEYDWVAGSLFEDE